MWLQHDGTPTHRSLKPHTYLTSDFGNIIGYGGPNGDIGYGGPNGVPPPASQKNNVCKNNPLKFFYDLWNFISIACRSKAPTMSLEVQEAFISGVNFCTVTEGSHFKQVLR